MECQPQSSPPEPCPLYWSCQISRGHSIKSEFQISKKCMGSLNDYLLLTHTHAHTHMQVHTHTYTHRCTYAHMQTRPQSYQRLGFLTPETPTGELSELGRVPPGPWDWGSPDMPRPSLFPSPPVGRSFFQRSEAGRRVGPWGRQTVQPSELLYLPWIWG